MVMIQSITEEYRSERNIVLRERAESTGRVVVILAGAIALMVLIGWKFDIVPLRSVMQQFIGMNPVTAVCVLLLSTAILILGTKTDIPRLHTIAIALPMVVAGVGAIKFQSYFSGWDGGIDQFLFHAKLTAI